MKMSQHGAFWCEDPLFGFAALHSSREFLLQPEKGDKMSQRKCEKRNLECGCKKDEAHLLTWPLLC